MTQDSSQAPVCRPPREASSSFGFVVARHACDSHAHIFGPYAKFPLDSVRSYTPREDDVTQFLGHLDSLGFERGVLVTASVYGLRNDVTLAALRQYPKRLRGVAVADAQTSLRTLADWYRSGIRGLRFNLYSLKGKTVYKNGVGFDSLEALAPMMREVGLHAQIWVHAPDLVELAPRLRRLGIPLVIDHMGRMNASLGVQNPGFQMICTLLSEGVAWTKISGADRNTCDRPHYRDIDAFALSLLRANPERVVWGSDWPHINYFEDGQVPDDGLLLRALHRWLPDEASRSQVFVKNPEVLYGFQGNDLNKSKANES